VIEDELVAVLGVVCPELGGVIGEASANVLAGRITPVSAKIELLERIKKKEDVQRIGRFIG
jgi:hypothetical protein